MSSKDLKEKLLQNLKNIDDDESDKGKLKIFNIPKLYFR